MGLYTQVEVHSAKGRADAVVTTKDTVYVFEFKLNGTKEEALKQIDDKSYSIPYQTDGRKIVKIGVGFEKDAPVIKDWIVGMDYIKKDDGKYEDEKSRTARIIQLRNDQEKNAEIPGKAQQLQLKILKNRNGRKCGVEFDFHPMFNCFEIPKPVNGGWTLKAKK